VIIRALGGSQQFCAERDFVMRPEAAIAGASRFSRIADEIRRRYDFGRL